MVLANKRISFSRHISQRLLLGRVNVYVESEDHLTGLNTMELTAFLMYIAIGVDKIRTYYNAANCPYEFLTMKGHLLIYRGLHRYSILRTSAVVCSSSGVKHPTAVH